MCGCNAADATPPRRDSHRDGFLVSVLAIPLMLSAKVSSGCGDSEGYRVLWWSALCCGLHATVLSKRGREGSRAAATASAVACTLLTAVFGPPGAGMVAHVALSVAVFHAAFRGATRRFTGDGGALSRGEALLVAKAVSVYAVDGVFSAVHLVRDGPLFHKAPVAHVLQVLLIGVCALAALLEPALRRHAVADEAVVSRPDLPRSVVWTYYSACVGVVALLMVPWMTSLLGSDPFSWVAAFLLQRPGRAAFAAFWAATLGVVIVNKPKTRGHGGKALAAAAVPSGLPNIVARKVFHAVAVVMFVPGLLLEHSMLYLAFGVATAVLAVLELARIMRIPPIGPPLHAFMSQYVDARDKGVAIRTHIYLLLGCALPVWLSGPAPAPAAGTANEPAWWWGGSDAGGAALGIAPFAGVLVTGVADAAAAAVGSTWGRRRWPGTKKTYLGTAAAFTSLVAAALAIDAAGAALCAPCGRLLPVRDAAAMVGLACAAFAACILETFTAQVDNVMLPLYFWTMVVLVTQ